MWRQSHDRRQSSGRPGRLFGRAGWVPDVGHSLGAQELASGSTWGGGNRKDQEVNGPLLKKYMAHHGFGSSQGSPAGWQGGTILAKIGKHRDCREVGKVLLVVTFRCGRPPGGDSTCRSEPVQRGLEHRPHPFPPAGRTGRASGQGLWARGLASLLSETNKGTLGPNGNSVPFLSVAEGHL